MIAKIKEWFHREPISLDREDGVGVNIIILCPPEHGFNCRCTWR